MLCRFCCTSPPSVRAHIIPKSFFVEHADDRYPSQQVTDLENVFPKPRHIGVYNSGILCEACEPRFSLTDDYGYNFFHPAVDYQLKTNGAGTSAYVIDSVDYDKLKRFLLSILWRASVSTQDFYAGVNLGPREENIRQLLRNENPGTPDTHSIYIERFDYPAAKIPILCPLETDIDDVKLYLIILNGFLVHISIDEKPFPEQLQPLMLRPRAPLIVPQVPYKGSHEYEIIQTVRRNAYKRT